MADFVKESILSRLVPDEERRAGDGPRAYQWADFVVGEGATGGLTPQPVIGSEPANGEHVGVVPVAGTGEGCPFCD